MDIKIDTVYRTRIEFSFDNDWTKGVVLSKSERVCEHSLVLDRRYSTIATVCAPSCNPNWKAYMEIEGPIKADVFCAAVDLCRYIKRFRDYHIDYEVT